MKNPIRTAVDLVRVLLDAIRNPQERGGGRRDKVSTPAANECVECGMVDGAHAFNCSRWSK